MNKLRRTSLMLFGLLLLFVIFLIIKWPDKSTKIIFCDVGQGDSILIQQGFFQVVVDSGRGSGLLRCLGNFLPVWDQSLEGVFVSHFDEDHMGVFGKIMDLYQVGTVFYAYTPKDTRTVKSLQQSFEREAMSGAIIKHPILGQVVSFPSGGKITFIHVPSERSIKDDDENGRSLVFLMEEQGKRILFTGDIDHEGELWLEKNGYLNDINVLKVSHHGSKTGSHWKFLEKVNPELAIISVGAENKYGHPDDEVLRLLKSRGTKVFRTDELGDVVMGIKNGEILVEND